MIPPHSQWCHQISVTSACWPRPACSNCTRLLGHEPKRYHMTPDQFEAVLKVAVPFLQHSPPDIGMTRNRGPGEKAFTRRKVLGIFGGEPLMHPQFPELVDLMCQYVPQNQRGLWTSLDWTVGEHKTWGKFRDQVTRLLGDKPTGSVLDDPCGYLNWNMHEKEQSCEHSPVLAAADDVIPDRKKRWSLISRCWLQTEWSAAYALDHNDEPKFYFCEVASAFDRVFRLGTGLPLEEGVWSHYLWFEPNAEGIMTPKGPYAKQILSTCGRCGGALKLPGRKDNEWTDDISTSNLKDLVQLGSPMVKKGQFVELKPVVAEDSVGRAEEPWEYQKDNREKQAENFEKAVGHADWLNDLRQGRRVRNDW